MKRALLLSFLVHVLVLAVASHWWPDSQVKLLAPEKTPIPLLNLKIASLPNPVEPVSKLVPVPEEKPVLVAKTKEAIPSGSKVPERKLRVMGDKPSVTFPAHEVSESPKALQLGDLGAQIAEIGQSYATKPGSQAGKRMVYVQNIRRHRFQADAYERAWQQKVEGVGQRNYPEQARKMHLTGSLLVSVAIRPDGSVYSAQVKRSSGHPQLDEAALRIVHLAAPFAPLPVELREETDFLVITRTWKFLEGDRLETVH